ncbi:MAG: helix-turn-helix domain-containing protein [Clostridia bacterium]|jgi:transcriptional regulator with XRE-family HTH domain|nr:helix-turn-helix domain-containing protein [Clostridia bacterium]MCI2013622.1 helix-turn-helix domain-containing protein [Clostridia bacterium]
MAIGERIRFIRNLRGMTQKMLGIKVGFDKRNADVRMAQYESGTRTPKENLVNALAEALEVSPKALTVPEIDSYIGLMHTFFALEDLYGIKVGEIDGELCLRLDKSKDTTYLSMLDMFSAWQHEAEKFRNGEITQEEYNTWRYNYPSIQRR